MSYKPGDAYCKEFATSSPTTGAATNADTLPVATANRNGADDATFALTVANLDAGRYKITGTIPAGYAAGDVLNVSVAATVGGVAGKAVVDTAVLDTARDSDVYARVGANGAGLTAIGDARLAHLDADVSSRLATAGYIAPDNADVAAIKAQTDKLGFAGTGPYFVNANVAEWNGATVTGSIPDSAGVAAAVWSYTAAMRDQDGLTAGVTAWDCVSVARQSIVGAITTGPQTDTVYMPDGATVLYTVQPANYTDLWDIDLTGRTFTTNQAGYYLQNHLNCTLAPAGLDQVAVETASGGAVVLNARQSLSIIAAAAAGTSSGLGSGNPVYNAAGVTTPAPRIRAVTDPAGDRSSVTLSPPA